MTMTPCSDIGCRPSVPSPAVDPERRGRRGPGRRIGGGFALLAVLLVLSGAARGGSLPDILTTDPDKPWEIKAETVEYDSRNNVYVARDGVVISKGKKRLSADHVIFDHKNMTASAEGHVVMVTGGDVLSGDRIDIDLEKETGTIYQGQVFTKEKHFHNQGGRVEKVGKKE